MKKVAKNIFISLLTFMAFYLSSNNRYDFFFNCIIFVFFYFFIKTDKPVENRIKKYSIFPSIILSLMLSFGNIIIQYVWSEPIIVFNLKNIIKLFIMFVGFFLLFNRLIMMFLLYVPKIKLFEEQKNMKKRTFFTIWLIIFLCWMPYFIRWFPAIMSPDSYYVIHYANNFILSDLHTFGHTWFFGLFFHIGKLFTSNLNIAVSFGTIAQMLILSLMFTTVIKYLYKKGLNKWACLIILIVFALFPLNGVYSIKLWRDVLFGGAFSVICIYLFEYITNNYKLNVLQITWLILCIIILLFFRNNGIFVFLLMVPFIVFLSKKHKIITAISGILIILCYFFVKGPIFDYFGIMSTKSVEAYSIPLQQIARVIYLDGNISKDDNEVLQNFIQIDKVKSVYKQYIADPIKNISLGDAISSNKLDFIILWFKLLIKNPQIYIESYMYQTLGYWYPSLEYGNTSFKTIGTFDEKVGNVFLTENIYNDTMDYISSKSIPFANFIWSIGTYFVLLILSTLIIFYKRDYERLIVFIPIWSLWAIIMISTPVFSSLRYVYGMFTAMPILLCIPFYKKEKIEYEIKDRRCKNEKN